MTTGYIKYETGAVVLGEFGAVASWHRCAIGLSAHEPMLLIHAPGVSNGVLNVGPGSAALYGRESLQALRKAIDFALKEPA